jgi:hypothetical protein
MLRFQCPTTPTKERQPRVGPMLDNLAVKNIPQIDQARDFRAHRPAHYLARRPILKRAPAMQHNDAIRKSGGFLEIVRHEQDGYVHGTAQARQLALQPAPRHLIDRRKRLVEKQDRRISGERARYSDTLLLSAGERRGPTVIEPFEAN